MSNNPHSNQPLVLAGVPLASARVAVLLLHGRGSSPDSMLNLAARLDVDNAAILAPTAAQGRWYPRGFMEPTATNEPDLSGALAVVTQLVQKCEAAGLSREHIVLGGFSQGACLAAEWAARNPGRLGGLAVLSGGLIGPDSEQGLRDGSLDGTPVLVGCSEQDPWIPRARVEATAAELERMGGTLESMYFPGDEHGIRDDETRALEQMVRNAARR